MYADDLVIISPSAKGLQRLVDICAVYGQNHDILFKGVLYRIWCGVNRLGDSGVKVV